MLTGFQMKENLDEIPPPLRDPYFDMKAQINYVHQQTTTPFIAIRIAPDREKSND